MIKFDNVMSFVAIFMTMILMLGFGWKAIALPLIGALLYYLLDLVHAVLLITFLILWLFFYKIAKGKTTEQAIEIIDGYIK